MHRYKYRLPERFDPHVLRTVLSKEFGNAFVGWCETPNEIRIDFTKNLTPEEKSKLDAIMSNPPTPTSVYEFGVNDIENEIEKTVGVKPIHVDFDETTGKAKVYFDKELNPNQEKSLENLLKNLRAGKLKKIK